MKSGRKSKELAAALERVETSVFFESPHRLLKTLADWVDKIRPIVRISVSLCEIAEALTGRGRPDKIKAVERKRQRVGLVEFERVARLRPNIDTDDFETSASQAHCSTTCATEKIECSEIHWSRGLSG